MTPRTVTREFHEGDKVTWLRLRNSMLTESHATVIRQTPKRVWILTNFGVEKCVSPFSLIGGHMKFE